MSIVILCEKPVIGQEIAKALPGKGTSKDGVIYKENYVITWAFGHLIGLKEPEDYDEEYKDWKLEDLPIYFKDWGQKITTPKGKASNEGKVRQIGKLLKDAEMVIHAGDVDEEGQLLIDELLRWHHYTGPVKRLDTSDLSTAALRRALGKMKDNRYCEADGWAAYARSVADLMVGVNMSRYFTLINNVRLTVGRVQTPTLGLVVSRDYQIEHHKKTMYYELFADLDVKGQIIETKFNTYPDNPELTDGKFLSPRYLQQTEPGIPDRAKIVTVSKKIEKQYAPLPFNLVKLQSYCGKKWGYSPTEVMDLTQTLREDFKAITYNRSDCQYLTMDQYHLAPSVIEAATANLGMDSAAFDPKIKSRCFNDANVSAHHAIIPTTSKVDVAAMKAAKNGAKLFNVYLIICAYYLAQFLPPAQKEKTSLESDLGQGETLKANASKIISDGYLALLPEAQEKESPLSSIPAGKYQAETKETRIVEKETKPPARYTLHSLNEDMTRISKYVDDPEIKKMLLEKDKGKEGENGSIGTSATRGSIIDNLIRRNFFEVKGKTVISTPLGRELYRILPDEIKKPDLTAKWWAVQEDIKEGKADYRELPEQVYVMIQRILNENHPLINKKLLPSGYGGEKKVLGKCPECGGNIYVGAKGYFCDNKECDFVIWPEMRYYGSKIKMSESKVKALISGNGLKCRAKTKAGKEYDLVLKLQRDGEYINLVRDEEATEKLYQEVNYVGTCPECGSKVKATPNGYFCENDNCTFAIWPEMRYFKNKIKMTDSKVKDLLSGSGLRCKAKTKDGKEYELILKLQRNGEYINLVRDDEATQRFYQEDNVVGSCPVCGYDVVERQKGYFCKNEDCRFALWKEMRFYDNKVSVTPTKAAKLLENRALFSNLKNKDGDPYSAYLRIELNGKYVNLVVDEYVRKKKQG